ncbi:MAG: hypothetical protein [Caudoviricetes sp.]|nr:MAG: hypothetical protein [Caudoviricetes sp.]
MRQIALIIFLTHGADISLNEEEVVVVSESLEIDAISIRYFVTNLAIRLSAVSRSSSLPSDLELAKFISFLIRLITASFDIKLIPWLFFVHE